jgi:hypothetical protein
LVILITFECVGIITNVKARLLYRNKRQLDGGALIEEVIWKLPEPEFGRPHGYKYRLVHVRDGKRVVGYDNERGKGDHCHHGSREEPYRFTTLEQLLADFRADVAKEEAK